MSTIKTPYEVGSVLDRYRQEGYRRGVTDTEARYKALVEAFTEAQNYVHAYHPPQYSIAVGKGICEYGVCKRLRAALAHLQEVTDDH